MEGLESMCALTRAFRRLTGVIETGISCGLLGLEGSRPLRPFKLAVLTTVKIYIGYTHHNMNPHLFILKKSCLDVWIKQKKCSTLPSFTIPTTMHFWKRQYWHRFRRLLSTGQFLFARQTYLAFFCTVRYKETAQACGVLIACKSTPFAWTTWTAITAWSYNGTGHSNPALQSKAV